MTGTARREALCERRPFLSGLLLIGAFFASVFAGLAAVRVVTPGASMASLLGAFMLPVGWALGWLGVRHMAMALLLVLAPLLFPLLLLWVLWRVLRGRPALGDAGPGGWTPDPWVFLSVPACALTGAVTGLVGALQAGHPLVRSIGLMAAAAAAWGLALAVLQYRGVLPDEGGADTGEALPPG
ncbi:MAG: hypothetical protein M9894_13555 [Planctomycetes bacterium]|nr:hypothetical protein [Planctomycetota bacterium]